MKCTLYTRQKYSNKSRTWIYTVFVARTPSQERDPRTYYHNAEMYGDCLDCQGSEDEAEYDGLCRQ